MKYFSLYLLFLASTTCLAQYNSGITYPDKSEAIVEDTNNVAVMLANSISAKDLKRHLFTLASDEYEGRDTGEKGSDLAATYIANYFKDMGLPTLGKENNYFQRVAFNRASWKNNTLIVNGEEYKHLWEYMSMPALNEDLPFMEADEIIYLGYGIEDANYSDYKNVDISGKIIMINDGEPMDKNGNYFVTGTTTPSLWTEDVLLKLKLAKEKGAKLVLIISNNLPEILGENRRFLTSPRLQLGDGDYKTDFANHAMISTNIAKAIIGKKTRKIKRWRKRNRKKGKSKALTFKSDLEVSMAKELEVIAGNNVLGYIEGIDKKDELVVISAHYDHLGKTGNDIYNGADDNASGTSTVMEIAEAFQLAKELGVGPRRSVLCLLVTGEEKGLLGSEYYSEFPVFPIENTVVNVNIDMVGRVDEKHAEDPNYIYVIGSDRLSTDLHKINEKANQKYAQLILDYQYNDEQDPNRYYYRSDHYNFARKGVPAIFFFNGTHEDYHRTSDTADKIEFEKMEKRGRLFFHTAWELANRPDRIVVDGVVEEDGR